MKWNGDIRAYKIYDIHYILYIAKPISFADNQFDFIVGCLNPGIAQSKPDRVKDVILMTLNLLI